MQWFRRGHGIPSGKVGAAPFSEGGFERIAPILMTSDPDEWEKKPILNPFTELTPWELGDVLKIAVLAIYEFWSSYDQNPNPIRASISPGRNVPEMNSPRLALLASITLLSIFLLSGSTFS